MERGVYRIFLGLYWAFVGEGRLKESGRLLEKIRYFIMFKDSNVFEFTNFPFTTKYNISITVVYSVNSSYLFSRGKQEKKLLKQFCY